MELGLISLLDPQQYIVSWGRLKIWTIYGLNGMSCNVTLSDSQDFVGQFPKSSYHLPSLFEYVIRHIAMLIKNTQGI